ncbi:type III polyketide synthase [Azospirillum soli]|uniref:type III polyketide synthase n=1 Tax=Azospirillum soli TaxID=1304799 RepID=UPI001AE8F5F2|nr:type III polyketide synthase [Azospirillum soli]MBP2312565.1 putative naringenin-chalcone synthase [Azospirillum soli]
MTTPHINRIGTAVPAHDVHRKFVEFAPKLLSDERARRLFQRMAERCQIEHRYSSFEPDPDPDGLDMERFFRRGAFPDTAARMRWYERHALGLAEASLDALEIEECRGRITHLIVASCTGFYAPGLDLQLVERFGLNASVERTIVGFMGCYAAMNALKLARHIVRSEPSANVLVVNLELCTLHLQETDDLEQVLSFLIFADGCASCLVSAEPEGIALEDFRATVVPDSGGQITWRIGQQGFDMFLAGAVPSTIARGLPQALGGILGGRSAEDVELWAVHPGGRTILDAVEQAAGLEPDRLADSRAVLRDFGNMSSATVVFVLKRMLDRFRQTGMGGNGLGCAMAFGPGLTAESMLFRMAAP